MLQQDTISPQHEQMPPEAIMASKPAKPQHPYQVLKMLPKDATPAQQDSAIQATFQPKEIRYSSRPDTLHIPGHEIGKSIRDVSLPKYYKESFFSKDTLFHPEIEGGRYGVAGDPIPYTVRSDDTISLLLILSFVVVMVSYAKSKQFIIRQIKSCFYINNRESSINETSIEIRFQLFMVVLTCLLLSLLQYFHTTHYIGSTFILSSQYHLIAIFFGMNICYFIMKGLLYSCVNTVFFGKKNNLQWMKTYLFITSLEGVMLYPAVLLQSYFDMSIQAVTVYTITALFLVKLLTFYKSYTIFFSRTGVFFQIFLYFCALEAVPMASFRGALEITGNYLKINF
ncbi:MAG: DUF4271 domain-containing protein [Prevotellaceae bacterium]|nr:DUF4271 domain-containing protein [Prevotellaceae bacterium]